MSRIVTQEDIDKLTAAMNELEHGAQASLRTAGQTLYDSHVSPSELQKIWNLHEAVKRHWHKLNVRRNYMRDKLRKQQPAGAK